MKITHTMILLSALLLLIGLTGCVHSEALAQEPAVQDGLTFQEYLWYENPAVLMVQIGVMLAGVLGVAALLPAPDEEGEPHDTL